MSCRGIELSRNTFWSVRLFSTMRRATVGRHASKDEGRSTIRHSRRVTAIKSKNAERELDSLLKPQALSNEKGGKSKLKNPESLKNKAGVVVEDHRSPIKVASARQRTLTAAYKRRIENLQGNTEVKNFDIEDKDLIEKIAKVTNMLPKGKHGVPFHGKIPNTNSIDDYSFEGLKVHPKLVTSLAKQGIFTPTEIQQSCLKSIAKGSDIVIHSETGSGKTLAYLLPILQDPGGPCGSIIVVPSRELALQVYGVATSLLSKKSIVDVYVSGNEEEAATVNRFRSNIPRILIGTPKILSKIISDNEEKFLDVSRIVFDEVDRLLNPSLKPEGRKKKKKVQRGKNIEHEHHKAYELILAILQAKNYKRMQMIASTATVNASLVNELISLGWKEGLSVIKTDKLKGVPYQLPDCIRHNYAIFSSEGATGMTKVTATLRVFKGLECKSALVFIQRGTSPISFVNSFTSMEINAVPLHQELSASSSEKTQFLKDFQNGTIEMAVATEDIVRGLDIKDLDHIFLIHVPASASDYVHLAGRVGRQGRHGEVTTIISSQDSDELKRYLSILHELNIKSSLLFDQRPSESSSSLVDSTPKRTNLRYPSTIL